MDFTLRALLNQTLLRTFAHLLEMKKMTIKIELTKKRANLQLDIETLVSLAESNKRNFSASESKKFEAMIAEAKLVDERLDQLEDAETASEASSAIHKRFNLVSGVKESGVYHKDSRNSFFKDYMNAERFGDSEAKERLARNSKESRAIGTTDGSGGDFSIPAYMVSDFVELARPGRVVSNLVTRRELPSGYDTINVPKIASGTAVLPQTAQGELISLQDATTGTISSPVITIAGGQVVNQQLLDMSPISMDQAILSDLAADYSRSIENQLLNGTGTSGELTGIVGNASANVITYTSASPSVVGSGNLYAKISQAIAAIHDTRFSPPTAIVMTPTRWAWFASAQDSAGRPLVTPTGAGGNGAYNALGTSGSLSAGGAAGFLLGVPVYVTALIPKNLGAGTNQDRIVILRGGDIELFESTPRLEVLPQIYGANLQVLVRYFSYAALIVRNPKGLAVLGGTGLVYPPTF